MKNENLGVVLVKDILEILVDNIDGEKGTIVVNERGSSTGGNNENRNRSVL